MPSADTESLPQSEPVSSEQEAAIDTLCQFVNDKLSQNDTSELDALHEVGVSILDAAAQTSYGPNVTKEVAKRLNTYKQKIQFSIRFATAYDDAGLDELRTYQTHAGQPYSWSVTHIRFLLRVPNPSERAALAKECARSNWPCRKLELEVKSCTGKSNSPSVRVDINSIVRQLSVLSTEWMDFVSAMAQPGSNLFDRIQLMENSLTEKQKSNIRTLCQQFPAFTEKVCEVNGYLSQINLP
jgi:hypothetical protein